MSSDPSHADPHFPPTRWTLVDRAGERGPAALEELLRLYLPALRAYLRYTMRLGPDEADDLLQDFVASHVLEKNMAAAADRERGRFRTFLITALRNHVIGKWRGRRKPDDVAQRDLALLAEQRQGADNDGAAEFDSVWARQVLTEAFEHMRTECTVAGRPELWGLFESRVVSPILDGAKAPGYADLVTRFGLNNPAQAQNLLVTAKRSFVRALKAVLGRYEALDPSDCRLESLQHALGAA